MLINFYKIVCTGDEVYVGSTSKSIEYRWKKHISGQKCTRPCNSKILFDKYGIENCRIELIETRECETEQICKNIEGEHIRSIPYCINKVQPDRNMIQYLKDNKNKIKEQTALYHQLHKDEIHKRHSEYAKIHREQINARRRELYKHKAIRQFEKETV
jgi:hypothetical protein